MIDDLDKRLLEVLHHPMSDKARELLVSLRTDVVEIDLDDDRRARFPWTFTASNGMEFTLRGNGSIGGPNPGRSGWAEAVLEMLTADTDERVTWRWPVDEHFVVIRSQMPHLDTRASGGRTASTRGCWSGRPQTRSTRLVCRGTVRTGRPRLRRARSAHMRPRTPTSIRCRCPATRRPRR